VFFDTFNGRSARIAYNWLLPMGSHLYSRAQVDRLLDAAGVRLLGAEHDFLLPYGFYRKIPNGLAQEFRDIDTTIGDTPVGDLLASVSYWTTSVE
jgi:hypothetical protein